MATTTATCTLSSPDILSQAISVSSTMTLIKDNTAATGLEQLNYHRALIPTGAQFDLIPESEALNTNPANYVYIINKNTDVTDYAVISIKDEVIGSLYGGDWMFIPWSNSVTETEDDQSGQGNDTSIEITATTHDCIIEYALFHSGETLLTADDVA